MKLAYVTAGAGGMYCGSCMHDNTLVRALIRAGVDAVLVPTYTPIRTDEQDVSIDQVFFGGINVFLQQKLAMFRWLPRWSDRFLDRPSLIRWAARRGMETSAKQLGALTVSMLRGVRGRQRKEVRRLCSFLASELQPDVVVMSNMLIAGCAPEIQRSVKCRVFVTLQGDDLFLNDLTEPYRSQAFAELRELGKTIDGFLVNSEYYARHMSSLLDLPRERFQTIPLGLDTEGFEPLRGRWNAAAGQAEPAEADAPPPTIGYLARLAPEKGLHHLVEAFVRLRRDWNSPARLRIAGWLGPQNQAYVDELFDQLRTEVGAEHFQYDGEVDRHAKLDFLRNVDVLSVPTTYHEPKGLFVLEALAAGVPVVQPDHGAFPELLASAGGGRLVRPGDTEHLAETLHALLSDPALRRALGAAGQEAVFERHNAATMAADTLRALQ